MIKRLIVMGVAVATAVVLTAPVAGASRANGTAKTHMGFTVAYSAGANLKGHFRYRPTVAGTKLDIRCDGYTRYFATKTNSGVPKSIFNATNCFDADGVRYYIHAESTDHGEPGAQAGDTLSITVKTYPASQSPWTFKDSGAITAGNVLIRTHPNNTIVDGGAAA